MRIRDASMPVLVLHLHHGALGIARSLGRLGVPVYGMGSDPGGCVSSSRYFKRVFHWDFGRASDERSVAEILKVADAIGETALLVPGADDLVLLVAENEDALSGRFRFTSLPPELVRSMIDKKALYFLARENGIPTPETLFPETEEEVRAFAGESTFPIMLKGIDGTRLQARTGRKMMRVDTLEDLLYWYRELEEPGHPNLMLQQFIPGGEDSVWMFNGYFDQSSECLMGYTGKKIHQFPPYKGATSLGVMISNSRVKELTIRFARGIGYRGILDIGFRYDPRDDEYKLLDPNPRIGSTFRLFVGKDGLDVVRAHYLHSTGQELRPSEGVEGRKWMVEDWEIDSIRAYVRDGTLTPGRWFRDVWGVRELAWWALDDPVPAVKKQGELLRRGFQLVRKRLLGRSAADKITEVQKATTS